jgi:hypothetical protein
MRQGERRSDGLRDATHRPPRKKAFSCVMGSSGVFGTNGCVRERTLRIQRPGHPQCRAASQFMPPCVRGDRPKTAARASTRLVPAPGRHRTRPRCRKTECPIPG